MNNKEWKKWIFWFSFAVAVVVVYKTIDSVSEIISGIGNFFTLIMPFFMALLVAYILYMPCKALEGLIGKIKPKIIKKHARGLSVLLVYVMVILLIFVIINFIIPTVSTSIKDLAENIPNYYNTAMEYIDNLDDNSLLVKLNLDGYISNLKDINFIEQIINLISIDNISSYIKGIMGAASVIFSVFVTIVVSVYLLLERADIKSFLQNLSKAVFDTKTNKVISKYYQRTNSIFLKFIASQILDAIVVGIITSIAMSLMKVKYSALLGFLIGLFNVIPYFGAIIAVVISILITIFTGGFAKAIWLGIVVIILQQVDANIINPRILGNSLNLSPILVIFAVTIGGAYFGVLGMFLGVPVMAFIKLIIGDFIEYKNSKEVLDK